MKSIFIILFLIQSLNAEIKSESQNLEFTVIIDAGHGGHDSGAVGYAKIKEKDITLNMALAVKTLIKGYDKTISVILTREKDKYLTLQQRCDISNMFKPDLFISIHCDANTNKGAQGTTVYLQKNVYSKNYSVDNYKKSALFGIMLNEILKEDLGLKSRDVLFNNYQVLRNTLEVSPGILIETGFISNKQEAIYYKEKGQKAISYAITKAILKYKKIKK